MEDCRERVTEAHRTCSRPEHRALEEAYVARGKSIFQLRDKLKRAGMTMTSSLPEDEAESDTERALDDGLVESTDRFHVTKSADRCTGKDEGGNVKYRARFGRRRTKCEVTMVRSCGVIAARATCYGSEAVNGIRVSVCFRQPHFPQTGADLLLPQELALRAFPTPQSMPEFFIYDNNCRLREHLVKCGDHHFDNTATPVDVFHFNKTHKETDIMCQRYCNPALFPELIRKDGTWAFNMSVAEQTNVWLDGFRAIIRDMERTRYAFFLDEAIKRRNRWRVAELEKTGKNPWMMPLQYLLFNSDLE